MFATLTNRLLSWRSRVNPGILLALLATYIIWGTTYLGIRYVVEAVPPFLMAGSRFLVAGVILFVILLARGQRVPSWRAWRSSALVALLMLGGVQSSRAGSVDASLAGTGSAS
jgi:drug/metabolite transporter (DMT)-like permease